MTSIKTKRKKRELLSGEGSASAGDRRGGMRVFSAVEALEAQDADKERKRLRAATQSQDSQRRSSAALSQTEIASSLLECRILLQRVIHAQGQQLLKRPNGDGAQSVNVDNGRHDLSAHDDTSTRHDVLAKLLRARQMLTNNQTENDHLVDYEAILAGGNLSLDEQLQTEYEAYRDQWKDVLNRRQKDVRLHSGALTNKTQFRVVDSSFWHQVESTAQHEQMRELQRQQEQSDGGVDNGSHGYPRFDDAKVYQNMLKDFLSESAATSTATGTTGGSSVAAAAQQRLAGTSNSKSKSGSTHKKALVDRKASKGRKIRYTDIPKLANFTFPLSRPNGGGSGGENLASLDEDAWFRSLFGGSESAR